MLVPVLVALALVALSVGNDMLKSLATGVRFDTCSGEGSVSLLLGVTTVGACDTGGLEMLVTATSARERVLASSERAISISQLQLTTLATLCS